MPKITKQNEIDYIILGILNHEPMSGYDINGRIDRVISYFWPEVGLNQIYPSLKKLEKKKYVKMKIDDKDYPPKKIYSLTEEGKNQLIRWLSQPLKMTKHGFTLFQEFLLKLHFGGELPQEIIMRNIDSLEQWLKKIVELFGKYEQNLTTILKEDKDHRFFLLSVLFGKTVYTSLFNWIENANKILKE